MPEAGMQTCRRVVSRSLPVAVFVIFVSPGMVWAQDSIRTAQSLYASAAYHEALDLLDRLQQASPSPADERLIQQSRALCLLALGRDADAERAIAAVVSADPFFRPDESSVSPRVHTAFAEVRTRLLPRVLAEQYVAARRLFDAADWTGAAEAFSRVGVLAADPDLASVPLPVGDYQILAAGFMALARSRITPATAVPPQLETVAVSPLYDAGASDVTPPVTLLQQLPRWPSSAFPPPDQGGVIEVLIDEEGRVESASIEQPMSPLYDPLVLEAARDWLYEPARRGGHPVRFRKLIRVEFH
jgi:TonB family protein